MHTTGSPMSLKRGEELRRQNGFALRVEGVNREPFYTALKTLWPEIPDFKTLRDFLANKIPVPDSTDDIIWSRDEDGSGLLRMHPVPLSMIWIADGIMQASFDEEALGSFWANRILDDLGTLQVELSYNNGPNPNTEKGSAKEIKMRLAGIFYKPVF